MPKAYSGRGYGKRSGISLGEIYNESRIGFRLELERQRAGRVQGRMLGRVGEDWG